MVKFNTGGKKIKEEKYYFDSSCTDFPRTRNIWNKIWLSASSSAYFPSPCYSLLFLLVNVKEEMFERFSLETEKHELVHKYGKDLCKDLPELNNSSVQIPSKCSVTSSYTLRGPWPSNILKRMSSSRFLTDHSLSPTRKQEAICGKWSQIIFQASKYFLLDFTSEANSLPQQQQQVSDHWISICLLIKDFTSCLVELSFDTTDKQERAPKYKCQSQWLKEGGKPSEGDMAAGVELVLTAAPASPRCLQKEERWKGRAFTRV